MLDPLLTTFASIGLYKMLAIWGGLVCAALIRAFTGFGFALAAMPLLSLFVAPTEAVVITAALTLAVNLISLPKFWGDAPIRPLLPLVAFSIVGTALGSRLLGEFSVAQFQLWVGAGVFAACLMLTFYHPKPRNPWPGVGAVTGIISGLMNGAMAIPGPPVIIYTMATQGDPAKSRALLMSFFMMSALIALSAFGFAGYLTARTLWLFVLSMPAMLLGDLLGHALFARYGTALYRRLALCLLYAVAVGIALRALFA
jgi:uncharacterized membrane protein YfcA